MPDTPATRKRGPVATISFIVAVLLCGLIVVFALGRGDADQSTSRLLGQRVPALASGSFNIDDYRGEWVVVNFFATWCPPCIAEHPEFVELDRWGTETGQLQVVSVVFSDSQQNVDAFFSKNGGSWPVVNESTFAIEFQVSQIPETFIVDPNGIVVAHYPGQITAEGIKQAVGAS